MKKYTKGQERDDSFANLAEELVRPTNPPPKPKKVITMEQLKKIMTRWVAYSAAMGMDESDRAYVAIEQTFIYGAMTEILDCKVGEIMIDAVPPILVMCLQAGRPLTSVLKVGKEEVARLAGNNG